MASKDNIVRFKTPYDAHEHCTQELHAWHPRWQAALKAGDLAELRDLEQHFRHRVLAVYPKDAYSGSWAGANTNFAYRLYELSEYERTPELMTEARTLYGQHLEGAAPEWHTSMRSSYEHCYAEILLRHADVSGDSSSLREAVPFCERVIAQQTGAQRLGFATYSAILRRMAERDREQEVCNTALDMAERAGAAAADQDVSNGDLGWALQRQTIAALLLLKHEMGEPSDLSAAHHAVEEALSNYALNTHNFWIRPSRLADAMKTKAALQALGGVA